MNYNFARILCGVLRILRAEVSMDEFEVIKGMIAACVPMEKPPRAND